MPNFYIATGGTKAAGGSTPGDWSQANCYPTVAATKAEWTGAVTIVFAANSTIVETTEVQTASFATTTSVAFSCETSAGATWSLNSATLALINSSSAVSQTLSFDRITFTRATAMTSGATYALLTFTGAGYTSIAFTNCTFGPIDVAAYVGSLVGIVATFQGAVAGTVSFTDCTVTDIRHTVAGTGPYFRLGGTLRTYNWTRVVVKNCSYLASASLSSGWCILPENAQTFNFTDCEIKDCTVASASGANQCRAFLYMGATTPTVNIRNVTFRRVTIGTSAIPVLAFGWGFYLSGPYSCTGLLSEDCTYYPSSTDGAQLYLNGTSAVASATPTNIIARRCISRSGAALFISNGAGGTFTNVQAYDCTVAVGCIYSGGNGYFGLNSAIVARCTSSTIGGSNEGTAVYVRNSAGTATDKTVLLSNLTLLNNVNSASPFKVGGLAIENANATGFGTVGSVFNVISRNPGSTYDMLTGLSDSGTTNPNIAFFNCNTINGVLLVGSSSSTGATTADPVLTGYTTTADTASAFIPASTSPLLNAGLCAYATGCVAHDAAGRRARSKPTVGAMQRIPGDPY